MLHVVICTERYMVIDLKTNSLKEKTVRFAWLSRKPINEKNVVYRCNQIGRQRWMIEESILKEKRHGFQYEHLFSSDWTAMKGYHYLMRIGHLLNEIVLALSDLEKAIYTYTESGLIALVMNTLMSPWLSVKVLSECLQSRYQLRLAG